MEAPTGLLAAAGFLVIPALVKLVDLAKAQIKAVLLRKSSRRKKAVPLVENVRECWSPEEMRHIHW